MAIAAKRRAGEGDQPRPDREMPDVVAARDDDRVRFLAPAEDRVTDQMLSRTVAFIPAGTDRG